MDANTDLLHQRLADIESQLQSNEDDRDDFDDELCNLTDFTLAEYESFLARRSLTEYGIVWRGYRELMSDLLHLYIHGEDTIRCWLRDKIREFPLAYSELYQLAEELFWRVRQDGNNHVLTSLVAIISLADEGAGTGGCWTFLLADLYASAEAFGWEVSSIEGVLKVVSVLSSEIPTDGGSESTKSYLAHFSP